MSKIEAVAAELRASLPKCTPEEDIQHAAKWLVANWPKQTTKEAGA